MTATTRPPADSIPAAELAVTPATPARSSFRGLLATKSNNWMIVRLRVLRADLLPALARARAGQFIGTVTDSSGNEIPYAAFIAPALLAVSAMNGAVYDSTWNVFFKMHFGKLYEGMLSTSLGPLDVALGEITARAHPRRDICHRVHDRDAGARVEPGLDGDPRAARRAAHRIRVREPRHGDHQLPEDLPADGLGQLRAAADVPVLGDLLPAERLPAADPVGDPGAAALARRRTGARSDHRGARAGRWSSTCSTTWC